MTLQRFSRESVKEIAKQAMGNNLCHAGCRIRANNDIEAVERWLDEYFLKPATFRTYKREAERFLVWCVHARSKNLSILNRDDVLAYTEFLKNPSPKEVWCGPRRKKSNDGTRQWYPFAGPLSDSAIKTSLASLNSLMSYLVDARYVDFNPFALVRKKDLFSKTIEEQNISIHERILEDHEWQAILETIEDYPSFTEQDRLKKNRLRFMINILFFLGLRISELAHAKWGDCKEINGKWWFFVKGKGGKLGKIPINSSMLQSIMNYRHSNNKPPLPTPNENEPLILSLKNFDNSLTVRQMSSLIKDLAHIAAQRFEKHSSSYNKLLKFSPHWLRHLSASRQDLAGISFTNIKSNLRHQSEQTTRIYVHAQDDQRHLDMEKLKR